MDHHLSHHSNKVKQTQLSPLISQFSVCNIRGVTAWWGRKWQRAFLACLYIHPHMWPYIQYAHTHVHSPSIISLFDVKS